MDGPSLPEHPKPQSSEIQQQPLFDPRTWENSASATKSHDEETVNRLLVSMLAVSSVKGVGFKTLVRMYDSGFLFGFFDLSPSEIRDECSSYKLKSADDVARVLIDEKQRIIDEAYSIVEEFQKARIVFVSQRSSQYPENLFVLREPPRWLFVQGNLDAIKPSSTIAVVGTREPSHLGLSLAYSCARELAKRNFIVLSGLAKGIDQSAHLGAVDHYGQSVAVLGHGIISKYASVDESLAGALLECDGAIVSEYLPSTYPSREVFLRRNEIQVALSSAVIPVEMPSLQSGTAATIRRALSYQKPVVGITPAKHAEQSLTNTRRNLEKMEIRVFTVLNGNPEEFWQYLRAALPKHDWDQGVQAREVRFFRRVRKLFLQTQDKIPLDSEVIDRLAVLLKQDLG